MGAVESTEVSPMTREELMQNRQTDYAFEQDDSFTELIQRIWRSFGKTQKREQSATVWNITVPVEDELSVVDNKAFEAAVYNELNNLFTDIYPYVVSKYEVGLDGAQKVVKLTFNVIPTQIKNSAKSDDDVERFTESDSSSSE